jgi:hypothetical protein
LSFHPHNPRNSSIEKRPFENVSKLGLLVGIQFMLRFELNNLHYHLFQDVVHFFRKFLVPLLRHLGDSFQEKLRKSYTEFFASPASNQASAISIPDSVARAADYRISKVSHPKPTADCPVGAWFTQSRPASAGLYRVNEQWDFLID